MNLTAIKKYFEASYKAGQKIYVSRIDAEQLFISDGFVLLLQHLTTPVFISREIFPQMPPEGKTFTYQKTYGAADGGPDMPGVWKSTIDKSINIAKITEWTHGGVLTNSLVCRVFTLNDGRHQFIREKFLSLLITKDEGLWDYSYFAESPQSPLVVRSVGMDPLAVLMPVREISDMVYLTEPKKGED